MSRPILPLHQRAGDPLPICQWWAGCERVAQLAVAHPVLEWVATCRECARRIRREDDQ